jgi:hypothetical protein
VACIGRRKNDAEFWFKNLMEDPFERLWSFLDDNVRKQREGNGL